MTIQFQELKTYPSMGRPLYRARVPGGWILVLHDSISFYPDPTYQWDGNSLP